MEITDKASAAKKLGMAEREISSVELDESLHGPVVHMADGSSYIDIAEDTPDAKGHTGLAYFVTPHPGYVGPFPVFATEPDSDRITNDENSSAAPAEPASSGTGDEAEGAMPPADSGSPVPVKEQTDPTQAAPTAP